MVDQSNDRWQSGSYDHYCRHMPSVGILTISKYIVQRGTENLPSLYATVLFRYNEWVFSTEQRYVN